MAERVSGEHAHIHVVSHSFAIIKCEFQIYNSEKVSVLIPQHYLIKNEIWWELLSNVLLVS